MGILPEVERIYPKGVKLSLEVPHRFASATTHPFGAQVTAFSDGTPILEPRSHLHAPNLKDNDGGSFGAWPFGGTAEEYLPRGSYIVRHGPPAILTQWRQTEASSTSVTYETGTRANGEVGTYFRRVFGEGNVYKLRRKISLINGGQVPHLRIATTVAYSPESTHDSGVFYPLAEHPYLSANYREACVIVRDEQENLVKKNLWDKFHKIDDKGEDKLNDTAKPEEIEIEPGVVWLLPDVNSTDVVVINTTVEAPGNNVPDRSYNIYHNMNSKRKPGHICIEPIVGDRPDRNPTYLSRGQQITQTVDISRQPLKALISEVTA